MQVPMPPETAPDRHHIGYQEFGLSFHHAMSIVSLVRNHGTELSASAFALMRPMYETLQRGWWFTLCATDADAATFVSEDKFVVRKLVDVAAAIEAHPPFQKGGFFTHLDQKEWDLYHSFTHGGLRALAVYGHRPNLDPDFNPDTIMLILSSAARMSAVAAMGMCWVCREYDRKRVDPIYEQVLVMGAEFGVP